MSTVTGSRDGVKAKKRYRCELYDSRTGVNSDGWWTMHMHPECHAFEQIPHMVPLDWYEDVSEPAFERPETRA